MAVIPLYWLDGRPRKKTTTDILVDSMFDAVVDASGNGNYTSIEAAFNAGASSVFVRSGTYTETGDIVIPDDGALVGEVAGGIIINFNSSAFSVVIDGSGGTKETAGTISVTIDDATVTGSGTTFTNLSAGDYILIGSSFFKIGSITNNTSLELESIYRGRTQSGLSYIAQTMKTGCQLQNLIITSSTTNGIFLRAGHHCIIENVLVRACVPNIRVEDSGSSILTKISVEHSTGNGLEIDDSHSIQVVTGEFKNNDLDGVQVQDDCSGIVIDNCIAVSNGGSVIDDGGGGINITGTSSDANITNCVCSRNIKGINTGPNTVATTIDGCTVKENTGDGIDFDGTKNVSTSNIIVNNGGHGVQCGALGVVSVNHISGNTGNGIQLNFDDSVTVIGNICEGNTDGIELTSSDNCIINSNRCSNNSSNGLAINSGCTDTIVTGNNFFGNTGTNFVNNGTATTSANNKS